MPAPGPPRGRGGAGLSVHFVPERGQRHMGDIPRIVVHGDVAVDWLDAAVAPAAASITDHPNWRTYPGTRRFALPGGAMMLTELVRAAVGDAAQVHGPELGAIDTLSPDRYVHSMGQPAAYPRSTEGAGSRTRVYRIARHCGFSGPAAGAPQIPPPMPTTPRAPSTVGDTIRPAGDAVQVSRPYRSGGRDGRAPGRPGPIRRLRVSCPVRRTAAARRAALTGRPGSRAGPAG